MHSSISNFKSWSPWILLSGLVLSLLLLIPLEIFLRADGFRPSLSDEDAYSWIARRLSADEDKNALILLGSSRTQAGIDPEVLKDIFKNRTIHMLAIDDGSPLSVLKDVADDENFTGSVICEVHDQIFFDKNVRGLKADNWIDRKNNRRSLDLFENRIQEFLMLNFSFLSTQLNPIKIIDNFIDKGALSIEQPYLVRKDWKMEIDFSKNKIANPNEGAGWIEDFRNSNKPLNHKELESRINEISLMTTKIKNRGGDVVFFRIGTSGSLLKAEEETFPKNIYWDGFKSVFGKKAVHFKDIEGLGNINCPDDSHYDMKDSNLVTSLFAEYLVKNSILKSE